MTITSAQKYKESLDELMYNYKLNPEYYTVGEPSPGWYSFESTLEDFEGYVELPVDFEEVDSFTINDFKMAKWMIEGPFTGQVYYNL